MTQRRSPLLTVLAAVVTTTILMGCETGFIADAARENLSSFVIDVFTTAASESIDPSD